MKNREIKIYQDRKEVVLQLTTYLQESLREKDIFHLSLSGGSTPKEWFVLLKNYADVIPWEKIHFWWGDERCVPPESEESNYGEAQRILLDNVPVPPENIHRILGELEPEEARVDYEVKIKAAVPVSNDLPRFDLIILGLGTDGHTASIFQDQMRFFDSENICEVATHPESGQKRITLTGPVLNNAAEVVFLVTGASKGEIVKKIIKPENPELKTYPAERINPVSGQLIWMLDEEAAQLLG